MKYQTDTYLLLGVGQSELKESLLSDDVQSLVGRTLLVRCLTEMGIYKDYPIYDYQEHGKPYLSNYPGWHFNISHCEKAVVCVLSTKEVGIDVEVVEPRNLELAQEVLNRREIYEVMNSNDPNRSFAQYWTKKESQIKCYGYGLDSDLKELLEYSRYKFELFSGADYEICICQTKEI